VSQATIDACEKRTNDVERYREAVERLHKKGIAILACFVVGFDGDTADTFRELLEFVDNSEVDVTRFAILTPFPGTELYATLEREGRLLSDNRLYYDTEHVVFAPAAMTSETLESGFIELWRQAYTCARILRRALRLPPYLRLVGTAANAGFRRYSGRLKQRETSAATGLRDG
jgi:radical SAM superfamily enzyme YgiQ (UPF0313 family)